jgi:hypothetical protein
MPNENDLLVTRFTHIGHGIPHTRRLGNDIQRCYLGIAKRVDIEFLRQGANEVAVRFLPGMKIGASRQDGPERVDLETWQQ